MQIDAVHVFVVVRMMRVDVSRVIGRVALIMSMIVIMIMIMIVIVIVIVIVAMAMAKAMAVAMIMRMAMSMGVVVTVRMTMVCMRTECKDTQQVDYEAKSANNKKFLQSLGFPPFDQSLESLKHDLEAYESRNESLVLSCCRKPDGDTHIKKTPLAKPLSVSTFPKP